jgi:hypothetical protein
MSLITQAQTLYLWKPVSFACSLFVESDVRNIRLYLTYQKANMNAWKGKIFGLTGVDIDCFVSRVSKIQSGPISDARLPLLRQQKTVHSVG